MSCAFEEELTAYIDGELPPPRRAEVEAHLGTCASAGARRPCCGAPWSSWRPCPSSSPLRTPAARCWRRWTRCRLRSGSGCKALLRPTVLVPSLGMAAAVGAGRHLHAATRLARVDVTDAGTLELAANLELVEDYDVVGMDNADDMEVIEHLHELEVK